MATEKLLKRKISILESSIKLKDKNIEQLEYPLYHNGKLPPVREYIKPNHIFDMSQRHQERLHSLSLEIENIELKRKLKNENTTKK